MQPETPALPGLLTSRQVAATAAAIAAVQEADAECTRWAEAESIEVVGVFRDDDRSASAYATRERDAFEETLRFLQDRRADILIVWEASRATRDLGAFVRLRDACQSAGVAYSYKGRRYDLDSPSDRFATGLDALIAERDAGDIRDRNLRTVRLNAERGRPHGRIPYGYRRTYDPTTGVLVGQTPLSEDGRTLIGEAQVLADAADALLGGATLRQVCRELNARNIPTARKPRKRTLEEDPAAVVSVWQPETLRQLLRNPSIAGRRMFRGQDIGEADWPPIVDYGKWLQLQALFSDPSRLSGSRDDRGSMPRHLLSGIARCAECTARLKATTNRSRMARAYWCRAEGCMKVTVSADRADEKVERFLLAIFARRDFRDVLASAYRRRERSDEEGPDVAALIRQQETELAQADALHDSGDMTVRAYARVSARIERKIDELKSQQAAPVRSEAVRRLLELPSLADGWKQANLMDRREVVRLLLDVRVARATIRGRTFDYNRVQVLPSELLSTGLGGLAPSD
jgi:DNA invertase Pin-like site-specific DNA recombinase